jgi:hypothetical protein
MFRRNARISLQYLFLGSCGNESTTFSHGGRGQTKLTLFVWFLRYNTGKLVTGFASLGSLFLGWSFGVKLVNWDAVVGVIVVQDTVDLQLAVRHFA